MLHKCDFSIWSQGKDSSFVKDRAFSCYSQAKEGDFIIGKERLKQTAEVLAYNWVYLRVNPNDMVNVKYTCQKLGFNYNNLLDEEVDYLAAKTEEAISRYVI